MLLLVAVMDARAATAKPDASEPKALAAATLLNRYIVASVAAATATAIAYTDAICTTGCRGDEHIRFACLKRCVSALPLRIFSVV